AGVDDSICGLEYELQGQASWGIASWSVYAGPASASFSEPGSDTTLVLVNTYGEYIFEFREENSAQCDSSDFVSIYFAPQPVADAGNDFQACGTSTNLNAGIPAYGTGVWTSDPPGAIFSDPASPGSQVTVPAFSGHIDYVFTWTETSDICWDDDEVTAGFFEQTVAYAGEDDSVCGNQFNLSAIPSIGPTSGLWSVIDQPSGANVSFSFIHDPSTQVTVSAFGTYIFLWIEENAANASCSSSDSIVIEFLPSPNISAGFDLDICGHWVRLDATVDMGAGSWLNAPVSWASCPDLSCVDPAEQYTEDPWVYSSQTDTIIMFVYEETNGICTASDTVYITFWGQVVATHLVDPQDSTQCGLVCQFLAAEQPVSGSGYWSDLGPYTQIWYNGVIDPTAAVPDSAVAIDYGIHLIRWMVINGMCIDTSDLVVVRFIEMPDTYAGPDDTTCSFSYNLHATASCGTGTWDYTTSPGTPVFNNIYHPLSSVQVPVYGSYNFIWTEDNTGGCVDSDLVQVLFSPPAFIYGQILNSGLPMGQNEAHVISYTPNVGLMQLAGQSDILASGNYELTFVNPGNYILKAIIDDHSSFPDLLNTYYDSEYYWTMATDVYLQCGDTISADIHTERVAPIVNGSGFVSGSIVYETTSDPVYGADVIVIDSVINFPCRATLTDAAGLYELGNLSPSSYDLLVDIPGIPLITTHHFTVTLTDTLFLNYNFYVDTTVSRDAGIGIYADTTNINHLGDILSGEFILTVFPNPFNGKTSIEYSIDSESIVDLEIIDISGKKIENIVHNIWLGTHGHDIGAMTPLFYTLRDRDEILFLFEM
ncbi:MAG: hypothetical protein ABIJ16_04715, partial [Bacteroidota bacterium]